LEGYRSTVRVAERAQAVAGRGVDAGFGRAETAWAAIEVALTLGAAISPRAR
jgi:hypothetical protein